MSFGKARPASETTRVRIEETIEAKARENESSGMVNMIVGGIAVCCVGAFGATVLAATGTVTGWSDGFGLLSYREKMVERREDYSRGQRIREAVKFGIHEGNPHGITETEIAAMKVTMREERAAFRRRNGIKTCSEMTLAEREEKVIAFEDKMKGVRNGGQAAAVALAGSGQIHKGVQAMFCNVQTAIGSGSAYRKRDGESNNAYRARLRTLKHRRNSILAQYGGEKFLKRRDNETRVEWMRRTREARAKLEKL